MSPGVGRYTPGRLTSRVAIVLWDRYLGRRLDVNRGQMASDPATLELLTLRRELIRRLDCSATITDQGGRSRAP
jgi:hypothetical protein